MTPYTLAKKLNVPRTRIIWIVAEKIGITTDTALRLAKFFKTSPEFWMNMQMSFDLKRQAPVLSEELAGIEEYKLAG